MNNWEKYRLKLLHVKDWVQYWDREEDLADEIYDHLRKALYLIGVAEANLEGEE